MATCLLWPAEPRRHPIDSHRSVLKVRVYKGGVLSAFGHDHEIAALVASGSVDTFSRHVELRVSAATMDVVDPDTSPHDRSEIRNTMLGPDVLDIVRFPQILFGSTAVAQLAPGLWQVQGNLTLHGQTKPLTLEVKESGGRFSGHVLLKYTDFGIKPIRVAAGAVRVKEVVRIEFDIRLAS